MRSLLSGSIKCCRRGGGVRRRHDVPHAFDVIAFHHPPAILAGMNPKQRAAAAAIAFVQSGMVVGLGTGSTADEFLAVLGAEIASGRLRDIRGVPTSRQSEQRARVLGIPLA